VDARDGTARRVKEIEAEQARVVAWLEANVGGTVTSIHRQPRWRPVWFADVDTGGAAPTTRRVCVRGDRFDSVLVFPLEHEWRFQRVLEAHGIPVPHVIGWCDDPPASVMEAVPGRSDFAGVGDADRARIVDEYLQVLAQLHALPIEPFVEAGITRAERPGDSWRIGIERFESVYRATKVRPDPLMEFVLAWLWRHPLRDCDREAPIVWDTGQFHHDGGHLVSLVDFELGHVGDPMMDLAGWRMRDTIIPFGDFRALYARYEELSGRPVDVDAVQYHHLFFTLTNQLAFHPALARPSPDTDYMTYAQWVSETNLFAVEALAEILGVELEPVEIPADRVSPVAAAGELLARQLRSIEVDDEFVQWQVRTAFRLARHLQRYDQVGDAITAADLDDLHRLLGRRPESWQDGDSELERFVLADDGRHDVELVELFHRRWQRYKALMGPTGSAMATHLPIQPFR
jgi:aminoglycoside phosphotransferase (APT) family kinase protein